MIHCLVAGLTAVLLLAGCGYDAAALQDATRRAEASADRAEKAAVAAEASAREAQDTANRAASSVNAAESDVRNATEASIHVEMFYEVTHPGSGVVASKLVEPRAWYLIKPPHLVGIHDPIAVRLNQWGIVDSFDRTGDCQRAKVAHVDSARKDFEREAPVPPVSDPLYGRVEEYRLRYQSWLLARCVRTPPNWAN